MAHTFLVFDFGDNEGAAQQARHRVEGWKQGFRLGNKLLLKFEREDADDAAAPEAAEDGEKKGKTVKGTKSAKAAKGGRSSKDDGDSNESSGRVRVLVRLDFSDHEKLSHQRWLERIPAEEPFKSAKGETVRQGDATFNETSELFDSLD